MICPYGFIRFNTTFIWSRAKTHSELIRRELSFQTIILGDRTREMENFLSLAVFWIFFDDLFLWIYKI